MQQVPDRPQSSPYRVIVYTLACALALGLLAALLIKLLPGYKMAIVTAAWALFCGRVMLSLALEWHLARENPEALGVMGLGSIFMISFLSPLFLGEIEDRLRDMTFMLIFLGVLAASMLVAFRLGLWISKRRAGRITSEGSDH